MLAKKQKMPRRGKVGIIEKKHEGKWVAISPDYKKVLDYSDDIVALTERNGRENVVYMKALRSDTSYAFLF
jgi:hypothetical protein